MTTTPAPVVIDRITKLYAGQSAVSDVSLELRPGECVALIGQNGAGKTTLMKLMLGLIRPTMGRVRLFGCDPADGLAQLKRAIGFLPESVAFQPALTGLETLSFYARLKRVPVSECLTLLEQVGLERSAADRPIGTYSKGMRQRIGLAQALLGRPRLLLLDEPTSGLDPALRQRFYEIIEKRREDGAAVLLSSHALSEIEGRADRIVMIHRGRKLADGPLGDLRRRLGLPVRLRLSLSTAERDRLPLAIAGISWSHSVEGGVEFLCPADDKVRLLGAILQLDLHIDDIEISASSLDAMYADFLERSAAE